MNLLSQIPASFSEVVGAEVRIIHRIIENICRRQPMSSGVPYDEIRGMKDYPRISYVKGLLFEVDVSLSFFHDDDDKEENARFIASMLFARGRTGWLSIMDMIDHSRSVPKNYPWEMLGNHDSSFMAPFTVNVVTAINSAGSRIFPAGAVLPPRKNPFDLYISAGHQFMTPVLIGHSTDPNSHYGGYVRKVESIEVLDA